MKLLVLTQVIDVNHPVLGFFHQWLFRFAERCEQLTIICLEQGLSNLPANIRVLSLGKERGVSRLEYLRRFYTYLWRERARYDLVFVHMNSEYVLLAGWWWWLTGKKVALWRNHARGNWWIRLAVMLSHQVFCTSPQSYTARFKKTRLMPAGVDTDFFCPAPGVPKRPHSILFLGRIAPVKQLAQFVASLAELKRQDVEFMATIAGPTLPVDRAYRVMMEGEIERQGLGDSVRLLGPVSPAEALQLYREHVLYVNLTPAGSWDKTIFEAAACSLRVLAYNQDLKSLFGSEAILRSLRPEILASKISQFLLPEFKSGINFRYAVVREQSLTKLVDKLISELEQA